MPLPTSQPNWSPNTGLNLLNSLPRLSNGAPPGLNPPVSGHDGVPDPGFVAEDSRGLASVMAFGSIPIQNQQFRPFSPRFGLPNGLSSPSPTPAISRSSVETAQVSLPRLVSPRSSLRSPHGAEESNQSNQSAGTPGNLAGSTQGCVWVPDKRMKVLTGSGNGPVLTYRHNTSHPPWTSGADYNIIVDWRSIRVISKDTIAVKFNELCITARALSGLDGHSDPLPWCRDGADPVHEAAASAEYNMYVMKKNEGLPSSAEDNCLRRLLAGPDEEQVTPGRSVKRLLSADRQGLQHTSSSNTNNETHEVEELDEGEGTIMNSSPRTSKSTSVSVAGGSTRGRRPHPHSSSSDFEPFAVAKEQVERFYQCTLHLKHHPDTREKFGLITANRQTRTLKNRYDQLKVWLPRAERVSAGASGAQEVDEDLRMLLTEFINKEKELEVATLAAKEAKEAASTSFARAEDLRNQFSGRLRLKPAPAAMNEEDVPLDDEVGHPPANSIRAIRQKLDQKLDDRGTGAHMVEVTMKSSEAQERANEIALMGLERHEQQTNVVNLQRERELTQSQARLDLDSQMGQETLALRREELAAATSRKEKTEEHIDGLKSSVSNVQGTLAEMGSVLKLLVERIPGTNTS
ncbi:hypothetical protein DFH28DRAFT_1197479 [Melampsora americana]|nr:hypothetical protein DFH28DRAFT_1197479 [Melampsora americana]